MKFLLFFIGLTAANLFAAAQLHPSLSAEYEKDRSAVKIRWQHTDESITGYIVQRSSDNVFYTDLVTKNTDTISAGDLLKFTDTKPSAEKNYYRLKILRGGKMYEATLPVMVIAGSTQGSWVIYPVPVRSVLTLQYNGSAPIEGVIMVTIQSVTSGTVFTKLRMASTTRNIQIPVGNIGSGTYDIRVYVSNEVVWNQRFVK